MEFLKTKVFNFEGAIRGMRNPLESWDKSDSIFASEGNFILGEKDLALMQKLIKSGSDHRKFMRQILVSVDINAPIYFLKELDAYKVGTTANSTSTMHKLATTAITRDCFELEENFLIKTTEFDGIECSFFFNDMIENAIQNCILLQQKYLETQDKKYWRALIQILPESWLQTRTFTLSYENILSMYNARKNHKLKEWSEIFANWVKTLPYAKELIIGE